MTRRLAALAATLLLAAGCGPHLPSGRLDAKAGDVALALSGTTFRLTRPGKDETTFTASLATFATDTPPTVFLDALPANTSFTAFRLGEVTAGDLLLGHNQKAPEATVSMVTGHATNGVKTFDVTFDAPATSRVLLWKIALDSDGSALWGSGGRLDATALGGTVRPGYLRRLEPGTDGPTNEVHVPVPFFVRRDGLAMFFHAREPWLLDASDPKKIVMTVQSAHVQVMVFVAPTPVAAVEAYADVSGKPLSPPDWALAPIFGRPGPLNGSTLLLDARALRSAGLPAGSLYVAAPWMTAYSTYAPLASTFAEVADDVRSRGFRLVAEASPWVDTSDDTSDAPGMTKENQAMFEAAKAAGTLVTEGDSPWVVEWEGHSGALFDLTGTKGAAALRGLAEKAVVAGFDGFLAAHGDSFGLPAVAPVPAWHFADGTPPLAMGTHYGDLYRDSLLAGFDIQLQAAQPFVLARAAGFGGQTSAHGVFVPGLTPAWGAGPRGGLRAAMNAMLSSSMSGFPTASAPVGGSVGGAPSDELLARWAELASAGPLFLLAGADASRAPGEAGMGRKGLDALVAAARLYVELFPYRRNVLAQATARGTPPFVPFDAAFPSAGGEAVPDEYLYGKNILVAPVLDAGASARTFRVPAEGVWRSYWTGRALRDGESDVVQWGHVPMLVREGSILPLTPADVVTFSGADAPDVVDAADREGLARFLVFPGGETSVTDPLSGATATLSGGELDVDGATAEMRLEIVGAETVSDEDGPLPGASPDALDTCRRCYAKDVPSGRLIVHLLGTRTRLTLIGVPP